MEHSNKEANYFKQLEQLLYLYSIEEWREFFRYKILLNYISLEDDMTYKFNIYILSKDILVFDEKKQLFKEGYHILIPNLYLPKYLRKKILEELINK